MAGGMHGRGVAWQEGACVAGAHAWQGGMCGRGCAWWGGGGSCVAGETATAVDGTHPTGMLSCLVNSSINSSRLIKCERLILMLRNFNIQIFKSEI